MKKLLKEHGLNSDQQYFEMIVEAYLNGQKEQAFSQFKAMPKKERQMFVKSGLNWWQSGLTTPQLSNFLKFI